MSPLSIASRRLRGNESIYRSVPLFIDAATNRCCKVDREDDKQTQTIVAQHLVNSAAVRHYSCDHQHIAPPNHFSCTPFMLNKRDYHATSRKEILPFIAVGVLGATTVYTYRALEQMDKDWDDYYDKVDEYKAKTGIDPEKESVSKQLDSKKEDKTS
eukprot:scaffold74_cov159-Skeletonema_marinoi.AAC.3